MTVNVIFPHILDVFNIQTVSFFYQKDSKLRRILGLSHLLFNTSKRDQCRGMFCVLLLSSHLVVYT